MDHIEESNLNIYLKAMQNMREDDFTKNVLKPLFESMSFSRVDFVGGPYEQGKDLIAIHEMPLKGISIYAIQTKKIGQESNTSEKNVLSNLIIQLRQCLTKKIKLHNGSEQLPDLVFLATPYQVNTRLINEIHELLCMSPKNIEILDGPKVIELIKKNKPSLLESLVSISDKLYLHDTEKLNNIELMSALNQKNSITELNCYSDLAFFMGTIDSNILLDSSITIKKEKILLSKSSWDLFKKEIYFPLKNLIGFIPLTQTSQYIDDFFHSEMKKFKSEKNIITKRNIEQAEQLISGNIISIKSVQNQILISINGISTNKIDKSTLNIMNMCYSLIKNSIDSSFSQDSINEIINFIDTNNIKKISKQKKQSIFPSFLEATKKIKDIIIQNKELLTLKSEYVDTPFISISLEDKKITSWIERKCSAYKKDISDINNRKHGIDIISFLTETQKTLNALDILINKTEDNKKYIKILKKRKKHHDGLSISPFELFETKHDIAVYGGAGAGKTTTLQMYVRKLLSENSSRVIYIPLNRFINKVKIILDDNHSDYDILISLILISREIEATTENSINLKNYLLEEKKIKIVLDGLDEAYAKYPGIIDSINDFKIKHPSIQMLISSRDCVSYLSKVNFLGITLLPFSESQLYRFITSWFKEKNPNLSQQLIESIKGKEICEIVKTPLLATLLCDLAEKGIDIPSSESEIFTKRLELFCGVYDTYKDIKRTTLSQSILYKSSIKIGYAFHQRNLRSATKKDIVSFLNNDTSFNYSTETCLTAVEELITPCNILVFDHISETFSFGHLRYQEHLASLELIQNRSIEIIHYLKSDWWRGVLCLYAQACEFYSLIEDFTIKYHNIEPALITLEEMAKFRPQKERNNINYLLQKYEETDDSFSYGNEWDMDYY
uniref:NACHT domain-containing protein n=1 Tax=Photorhabdus sp. RM322S TaxID=3342825 RepID=UPI0036D8B429